MQWKMKLSMFSQLLDRPPIKISPFSVKLRLDSALIYTFKKLIVIRPVYLLKHVHLHYLKNFKKVLET